jgi:phospholipid transport system substrate-binding protein
MTINCQALRGQALAGLAVLGLALAAPGLQAQNLTPVEVVQETAGTLLDSIAQREEEYRASPELLRELVRNDLLPVLDTVYSARLILGRSGREASDEQIEAFAAAVSRQLTDRYADGLLEYRSREQMEVLPQRGELDERMTRVRTRVRLLNGSEIPVDYVFRLSAGQWKVFDVVVEGISYVTTYRNQIMPQVQESGIEAVTARLNQGQLTLQ